MVHAAAGGVGLLLTQLVKMRGGTVVATTSSPAKAVLAQQAGADFVAGYEDFGEVVRQVTGGSVLTAAGRPWCTTASGRPRSRPAWRRCAGAATWCCTARPAGRCRRSTCSGSTRRARLFVTRPTLAHYVATREELLWRAGDLFRWIAEGRLSVRVGGRYPLHQAAQAHARPGRAADDRETAAAARRGGVTQPPAGPDGRTVPRRRGRGRGVAAL